MSLLSVDNILNVCRLCLNETDNVINIFSSSINEDSIQIHKIIEIIGNTQVSETDGLPPQICSMCNDTLIHFYKFRIQVEQNYKLLLSYIQNTKDSSDLKNIKIETSLENEKEDDIFLSQLKDDDIGDDYDAGNDDEYKFPMKEKSKRKKSKKIEVKKKKKKTMPKAKIKIKKETNLALKINNSNDNKSYDKLSAALQKRLENRDKCPLCFEKLHENVTMAEHFYSHYNNSNLTPLIVNGNKTTVCNLCNKSYKFNSMIPHHRKHLKLYPFKCEIEGCDKAFASTMNLGWHLDNHNGVKKYQCQTCGKTFHLSGSLRNHEETHIIERAQCKICLKTYKNHIMLKLHMKRHIYGQRHKCEEPGCDKAFYSAQELRRHAHVHYGSKTFVCDVCSKPWYTEKELIRHKKYHDPVKQHQCSECMKTFVDKSQLRCHEMTHRGERPHVCEFCNIGFITKSKLKRHQIKSCKGAKHYQIL